MLNRIVVFSLFLCLTSISLSAQWSVGARFGGASGVSIKKYARSGNVHFEAIAAANFDDHFNGKGTSLTLLGEKFGPLSENGKLGAILGIGETMVFGDEFYLGVSGILGFDWRIGRRIGFQVDWLPTWIFVNDSYFSPINVAGTVRWVFGGRLAG